MAVGWTFGLNDIAAWGFFAWLTIALVTSLIWIIFDEIRVRRAVSNPDAIAATAIEFEQEYGNAALRAVGEALLLSANAGDFAHHGFLRQVSAQLLSRAAEKQHAECRSYQFESDTSTNTDMCSRKRRSGVYREQIDAIKSCVQASLDDSRQAATVDEARLRLQALYVDHLVEKANIGNFLDSGGEYMPLLRSEKSAQNN